MSVEIPATGPVEPVLELDDIQGAVVPGFFKPYQQLLGVRCQDSVEHLKNFKTLVLEISKDVTTGSDALADRRENRRLRLLERAHSKKSEPFVAIAFSSQGLLKLTPGASAIPSDAFQLGLAKRSPFLGDPTDPRTEGNPANWIVGGSQGELDALLVIAGDHPDSVAEIAKKHRSQLERAGLDIVYHEPGAVRHDKKGHEHFGFDDGVSQPGIRGRAPTLDQPFITERHVDASEVPATWLYGYPGQDLVWPGEFVLGYPATSPDPLIPGPIARAVPEWTRNGSFLVFRRLRQDVGLFWRTMKELAARLARDKGFADLNDEALAAKLVGRWLSGAPVNRTPAKDIPKLGQSNLANNHFRFDSKTLPLALTGHDPDEFPQADADPAGITCPWAAHIRKVNTRDSASDMGSRNSTYDRRILRVGVPFGKPLADPYTDPKDDPEKGNRGLLFLSVQASIENQFEFLCNRWVNDPSRPKMPGGHDFIIGQNTAPGEREIRRCVIFGTDLKPTEVSTDKQWVITTGGGYFFLPSISALHNVLSV
jgi:Dyp-type peroxidase family